MAEMAWIRRLARALVRDDAAADDVAQDAWLVATEQKPAEDRPLRPWLARVVVNLVRTRRRSDARRGERDAAFDAGRDIPTPAELVERIELQRAVADEVLALGEPYRSTVLLHFVERDHISRSDLEAVEDPAQSWNALTVGAEGGNVGTRSASRVVATACGDRGLAIASRARGHARCSRR